MSENSPADTETSGAAPPLPDTQTPASTIDPDFRRITDSFAAHSSYYLKNQDKDTVEFGKRAMLGAMDGIAPQDTIEAMLSSMLISLYNTTMASICRTTHNANNRDEEFGNVCKLSRAYAEVLETFNNYRGKGNSQQTITVVHINDGGQAIVGNVAPPGRGRRKTQDHPMQSRIEASQLPMHHAPRCGAKTRPGHACQAPAMPNGRCRMHGGASPGAPRGSQNALKHGRYTAEAIARRRAISALIKQSRKMVEEISGR